MLLRCALLAAILLSSASAVAQTGQKSMQIIVPFAPGASADGIGRIIATELGSRLGRQIVVENKAGAGGSLGLVSLAKAAPEPIIKTLTGEIKTILAAPDVQARVRQLAVETAYLDDVAFTRFLAAESAKWKSALQSIGLTN